jgi:hypothetical protein
MVVDVELDVELDVCELVVDVAAGTSAVVLVVASCPVSGVDAGGAAEGEGPPLPSWGANSRASCCPRWSTGQCRRPSPGSYVVVVAKGDDVAGHGRLSQAL